MTPEQQRIAIAEALGATWIDADWFGSRIKVLSFERIPTLGPNRWDTSDDNRKLNSDIPDYLNDLNAMHDGVASQGETFQVAFASALAARAGMLGKWTHQLTATDWADCFIVVLQSQRVGGNSTL